MTKKIHNNENNSGRENMEKSTTDAGKELFLKKKLNVCLVCAFSCFSAVPIRTSVSALNFSLQKEMRMRKRKMVHCQPTLVRYSCSVHSTRGLKRRKKKSQTKSTTTSTTSNNQWKKNRYICIEAH